MTNTMILQPPRGLTSSSSLRIEELVGPSVLPAQASIVGTSAGTGPLEELGSSMEEPAPERPVPLRPGGGMTGASLICTPELPILVPTRTWASLTGIQPGAVPESNTNGTDLTSPPEAQESVVADTDQVQDVLQMAQAWQAIGRPISEDDAQLSVDPDDYPLF